MPIPQRSSMNVPISRDLLRPEDFKIDDSGNLSLNKELVSKLVKENIHKTPGSEVAISVTVGVDW